MLTLCFPTEESERERVTYPARNLYMEDEQIERGRRLGFTAQVYWGYDVVARRLVVVLFRLTCVSFIIEAFNPWTAC